MVLLSTGLSLGLVSDPPDLELNPVTGDIESVDTAWVDSQWDVRHVDDPGQGEFPIVSILTTSSLNDLGPRIAIDASGDSWVVWWRDAASDEVLYRMREVDTYSWSTETKISGAGESSWHCAIVHDGQSPWVAYEIAEATQSRVAVNGGGDDPEPFPGRTILATTTFDGDLDVDVHAESGHLWVTWNHSAQDVGWREYDYSLEVWDPAAYESYVNDSVADARSRIRQSVLG
jgi:hypothetical protein